MHNNNFLPHISQNPNNFHIFAGYLKYPGIMKKFLTSLVILAALAVMPASAQVKFGVKGGMNFTNMKLSYENLVNKSAEGWFIGPTLKANIPIGLLSLGADGAVFYDQRRSKTEYNGIEESIKQHSIIIPINVRLNVNILKLLGAYVATGPQFGFNVGNSDVELNNMSALRNHFQFKKSQFSWNIGLGVMLFKHLEIGAAYNFAIGKTGELKDMTKQDILDSAKQKSLVVSAAYYF